MEALPEEGGTSQSYHEDTDPPVRLRTFVGRQRAPRTRYYSLPLGDLQGESSLGLQHDWCCSWGGIHHGQRQDSSRSLGDDSDHSFGDSSPRRRLGYAGSLSSGSTTSSGSLSSSPTWSWGSWGRLRRSRLRISLSECHSDIDESPGIMSYSASSLDDPPPRWSAYHPKEGVAWIPNQNNVHSDNQARARKSIQSFTLYGGFSSALGSVSTLWQSPRASRTPTSCRSVGQRSRSVSTSSLPMSSRSCSSAESSPKRLSFSILRGIKRTRSKVSLSKDSLSASNPDLELVWDEYETGCGCQYPEEEPEVSKEQERGDFQLYLDRHDLTCVFIDRSNLITGRLLMRDHHMSVCSGTLRGKRRNYPSYIRPICIQIHKGLNSEGDRAQFLQNIVRLARLRHENVMSVVGVCVEGAPITRDGIEMLMATERTHFHVTLYRLLRWCRENNPKRLTPKCSSTFALQICRGCRYLSSQKLDHRHLRAATIMLDTQCQIKLSGIEETPIRPYHGNTRWLPLETLRDDTFTHRSMVWSFGVVLWELGTLGKAPYPHLTSAEQIHLYLDKGKRLIRPDGCSKELYAIMLNCWRERPRDRMSWDRLLSRLLSHHQTLPASQPPYELFPYTDGFLEDEYI